MNAIEAVAEAIHRAFDHTPSDDVFGDCARAAINALAAQGDITDEQIADIVDPKRERPIIAEQQIAEFRALLARQAAVHATRKGEA
jgi:hypothetical protein